MQLSCFKCTTTFKINDELLGEGRNVRCSKCGHIWLAKPADDLLDLDVAEDISSNIATDINIDINTDININTDESQNNINIDDDIPEIDFSNNAINTAILEKENKKYGKKFTIFLAASISLFLLVNFTIASIIFSKNNKSSLPAGNLIFTTLNLNEADNLALTDIGLKKKISGKKFNYHIFGSIVNNSNEIKKIPQMRIKFLDDEGAELRQWEFSKIGEIKSGGKTNFQSPKLKLPTQNGSFLVDIGSSNALKIR